MPTDYVPTGGDLVIVSTSVPVPSPTAWRAITLPDQVSQWFGDLTAPMVPGASLRVDFGDGDFFDAQADAVRAEEMVSFRWRFLGVGPESEVQWELNPGTTDTTVTVRDSCPGRPPSEASQLDAGWRDFLDRLGAYLATGESARYAWREVIDGGTNLPVGTWLPLTESTVADWLPIALATAHPRWFFIVDNDGPRRFAIGDWDLVPGRSLRFSVAIPKAGTTHAEVHATVAGTGAGTEIQLTVRHDGWKELALGDMQARNLRHRFAAAWTAALKVAGDRAGLAAQRGNQ
jgi:uncharacterized protein YndB with AHSA1/START domain